MSHCGIRNAACVLVLALSVAFAADDAEIIEGDEAGGALDGFGPPAVAAENPNRIATPASVPRADAGGYTPEEIEQARRRAAALRLQQDRIDGLQQEINQGEERSQALQQNIDTWEGDRQRRRDQQSAGSTLTRGLDRLWNSGGDVKGAAQQEVVDRQVDGLVDKIDRENIKNAQGELEQLQQRQTQQQGELGGLQAVHDPDELKQAQSIEFLEGEGHTRQDLEDWLDGERRMYNDARAHPDADDPAGQAWLQQQRLQRIHELEQRLNSGDYLAPPEVAAEDGLPPDGEDAALPGSSGGTPGDLQEDEASFEGDSDYLAQDELIDGPWGVLGAPIDHSIDYGLMGVQTAAEGDAEAADRQDDAAQEVLESGAHEAAAIQAASAAAAAQAQADDSWGSVLGNAAEDALTTGLSQAGQGFSREAASQVASEVFDSGHEDEEGEEAEETPEPEPEPGQMAAVPPDRHDDDRDDHHDDDDDHHDAEGHHDDDDEGHTHDGGAEGGGQIAANQEPEMVENTIITTGTMGWTDEQGVEHVETITQTQTIYVPADGGGSGNSPEPSGNQPAYVK